MPLIQTPLGHTDSDSDTDSSSGFSTPTATCGESTKEETTTEKRPVHSMCCFDYIIFNQTSQVQICCMFEEVPGKKPQVTSDKLLDSPSKFFCICL